MTTTLERKPNTAAQAFRESEARVARRAAELTGSEREQFLWRAENARRNGHLLCACAENWHSPSYRWCAICAGKCGDTGYLAGEPVPWGGR